MSREGESRADRMILDYFQQPNRLLEGMPIHRSELQKMQDRLEFYVEKAAEYTRAIKEWRGIPCSQGQWNMIVRLEEACRARAEKIRAEIANHNDDGAIRVIYAVREGSKDPEWRDYE